MMERWVSEWERDKQQQQLWIWKLFKLRAWATHSLAILESRNHNLRLFQLRLIINVSIRMNIEVAAFEGKETLEW